MIFKDAVYQVAKARRQLVTVSYAADAHSLRYLRLSSGSERTSACRAISGASAPSTTLMG